MTSEHIDRCAAPDSASLGQYNIPLLLDEAMAQVAMGNPIDISRLSLSALFHRFTAHNMELDLKVSTIGSRAYVTPNHVFSE